MPTALNLKFFDYLNSLTNPAQSSRNSIIEGDSLAVLKEMDPETVNFVYTDPPYNTGKIQENNLNKFTDKYADFKSFICPIFQQLHRVMAKNSVLCVTLDYHEIHYAKVWLDEIFNRSNFMAEIIWLSELGRTSTKNWSMKHQTTLIYKKGEYKFNFDNIPRIIRKAAKEGYSSDKIQHSVLTYTMSNTDPERVGYPCQKPLALVKMLMNVHADPGDLVLDPFAGSGTTGVAAKILGMNYKLIDMNPQAIKVMRERLV